MELKMTKVQQTLSTGNGSGARRWHNSSGNGIGASVVAIELAHGGSCLSLTPLCVGLYLGQHRIAIITANHQSIPATEWRYPFTIFKAVLLYNFHDGTRKFVFIGFFI